MSSTAAGTNVGRLQEEKAVIKKNETAAPEQSVFAKQDTRRARVRSALARIPFVALMLIACSSVASAANINFGTDPFEGTDVRNTPGRQVVGSELFIAFHPETESFVFDPAFFAIGPAIHFANGPIGAIPTTGVNVVVLQTLDDDANPLTPFGAGNAANLLAGRITQSGPGLFVYFNSALNLARLVYSDDLSSNTADLKILARMLNFTGQAGIDALPTFTAANFQIAEAQATPEPSGAILLCVGLGMVVLRGRGGRGRSDRL